MRIVGGKFRGKTLLSPSDDSIRPTADRVREAVFNILASRLGASLDGKQVLDLFAGTGALGLEALSRGAARIVYVDTGTESRGLIRDHIEAFPLTGCLITRGWRVCGILAFSSGVSLAMARGLWLLS